MNRRIRHKETLIYYDGPQLFLARDQVSAQYLCLLVEDKGDFDKFLCVPVSSERLKDFYLGEFDLRKIYEQPESDELFYAEVKESIEEVFQLFPLSLNNLPSEWLPDSGFIFKKDNTKQEIIVEEAIDRNRAIVHFSLNPPESRYETKIHTLHLAEALIDYQSLVKHAYRKIISKLNAPKRKELDLPEYYNLDVIAFSNGSFTVHLQSIRQADMLGYIHVSEALKKIDEITQQIDNPDAALLIIQENKGHFANAYLKLLELAVKHESSLSYQWTTPELKRPVYGSISAKQAAPLYELLNTKQELTVEQIELAGKVIKADYKRGAWTLHSIEDDKDYNGVISDGSGLSLSGFVIEEQTYKFFCEERVEEVLGTGKERTIITLKSYEKI